MSDTLLLFVLVSSFGAIAISVLGTLLRMERRRRLVRAVGSETAPFVSLRQQELGTSVFGRVGRPVFTGLARVLKHVTPLDTARKIERKLVLAGASENWDVTRTFAVKVLCAVAFTLATAVLVGAVDVGQGVKLVGLAIGAWAGYIAPDYVLSSRARRRRNEIRKALPDTVDLLTIMIEAGLGFDAAIAQVTVRVPGELSLELGRMLREVQLGVPRMTAMKNMARRVEVEEFDSFVTSMIQAETFGVSVSKVLRGQSDDQRSKRRQRAERQAQQLPVKLVFPLIFCIMPAVFVVTLGPAVIRIMQTLLS